METQQNGSQRDPDSINARISSRAWKKKATEMLCEVCTYPKTSNSATKNCRLSHKETQPEWFSDQHLALLISIASKPQQTHSLL